MTQSAKQRPYTVEIVPADRGWILETMAHAIERAASRHPDRFQVSIVDEPSDTAELTFFLPESAYQPQNRAATLTYFAHREDDSDAAKLFDEVAQQTDHCVTSSSKYRTALEALGAKSVFKVPLGVDTAVFRPRVRIGVVGRTYATGRKGEALLASIADLPTLELCFTGQGWPKPAEFMPQSALAAFYQDIDYLLIPSEIEGGPVPLLESLASGCPVIASTDIGMVADFPHIPFQRGDADDLRRVVTSLLAKKQQLRDSVKGCDWSYFAEQHLEIFTQIIDHDRASKGGSSSAKAEASHFLNGQPVRVLLVTHGGEDDARGGPTSRVNFIESQLRDEGHYVSHLHNLQSVAQVQGFDTVHVFNSWPPHTALESMAVAKQAGKAVIFSPIALDLSEWPIYYQLMRASFTTRQQVAIKGIIEQLPLLSSRKDYAVGSGGMPAEGLPGHFEALRRCCAMADRVIFLSRHERDFLGALGARTDHGSLVLNGVTNTFDQSADPQLFRDFVGQQHFILSVGRLEYRKNQALLALAATELELPLVLIGAEGDSGYLDTIRLLGGSGVIHVDHLADKQLLRSAYAAASVFVLPSWSEGAPLAALEAGLIGAPLVLSDRSSEKEYFGEWADYIAPGDVPRLRDTIAAVLRREESLAYRASRAVALSERYSQENHVGLTLALYRQLQATDEPTNQPDIWLEVSALLHAIRSHRPFTGVALSEWHLVSEIIQRHPEARCMVYNDLMDRFIEVPYRALTSFNEEDFNRRFWFADDGCGSVSDLRNVFLPSAPVDSLLPSNRAATLQGEQGVPPGLTSRAARLLLRYGLPQPVIIRIGLALAKLRAFIPRRRKFESATVDVTVDFAQEEIDAASLFKVTTHARADLGLRPGSRILSLGQSWLSNEPLLEKLVEISAGNSLEPYVYDISYVSGAHFSGWEDNEHREARLAKLLRHCATVHTESRVTETEINKFAAARGMNFDIVTTGLRGKPASESSMRGDRNLSNKPFVLYVSSFNQRKNHDFIVKVWKDLYCTESALRQKGARLLLAGEVQGERKYADQTFVKTLAEFNIDVITGASDEEIQVYLRHCVFTVYPSLQEGWGIPIQESLTSGKVCVASEAVPAALEITNPAVIKLNPNDFFAWREAVLTWLTNDRMRSAFERRALEYSSPEWRDIAHAILMRDSA